VTVTSEMTIQLSAYGDGAELYLYNKTILINKHLVINEADVTGQEGAKIIIAKGATADWQGTLATELDTNDLTFINQGTVNILFSSTIYSGSINFINSGTLQMQSDLSAYTLSAEPVFQLDSPSQFWLTSTSNLVVKIFGVDGGTDSDTFLSNDQFNTYDTSVCSLGGNLTVQFVSQLEDCVPSCSLFAPSTGDRYRIFSQRSGQDTAAGNYPCFGQFAHIQAVGLDSSKKIGIIYMDQISLTYADLGYISVVICDSSDTDCGNTTNSNSAPSSATAGPTGISSTTKTGTNTGTTGGTNTGGTNTGTGTNNGTGTNTGTSNGGMMIIEIALLLSMILMM